MIPELVQRIDFRKGVYYADLGDFSSAGAADLEYYDVLPQSIVTVTGGRYGYVRELYASSPAIGQGHLLHSLEIFHTDGPWTKPDDFQKINGVARYSQGDAAEGFHVTAMAYAGTWNGTDQIARRALGESFATPLRTYDDFGLFDSLDTSDGGKTQRYSLSADWHRTDADASTALLAYGFYYDLDLFSNFSYFLESPQGDQIEQTDARWVGGVQAKHTWFGEVFGYDMQNTVGLQLRSDSIRNGLFNTVKRDRVAKFDYSDSPDPTIPATTRSDQIWEASLAPYFENRVQWTDKIRTVLGLRLDYFHVDVESHLTANSGTADDVQVSPKGSLVLGPWAKTELYLSGGQGFHSNDARGATQHVDPLTREPIEDDDLLVRTYGAEAGVRTTYVPGLQSTLSFWWLHLGSELVFVGDAGTTEASDPSQRYGVELANYYEPNDWWSFDADVAFSKARFTHTVVDDEAGRSGKHIPEAVESVIATGIGFHEPHNRGFFSELRLRYFGPRDLSVSGRPRSGATALLSANLGYHLNDHVTIGAEVFNLLDREDHDIDYFYPSFVPGVDPAPAPGAAPEGVNDVHFKPVEPISFRIAMTIRF
jgi:outer membrane receptor protein involved in Fe transport